MLPAATVGAGRRGAGSLHVLLGLRHDRGAGDVHAAGRELVGGEEVVRQVRPEVLPVLELGVVGDSGSAPRSAAASGCPRAPRPPPSSRWRRAPATGRWRCPSGPRRRARRSSLRKPFSASPATGTKGCLASIIACTMPVVPPWVNSRRTGRARRSRRRSPSAPCRRPSCRRPGRSPTCRRCASNTSWKPIERSRSTELPGTPRTSRILPPVLPVLSSSTTNLAASMPISFWSSLTIITLSVSRTLSKGTRRRCSCRRGGSPGRSRRAPPRW